MSDLALLQPMLWRRYFSRGEVVASPGRALDSLVFPTTAVFSAFTVTADGRQVETRSMGPEEVYGLCHVLASPVAFENAAAVVSGEACGVPRSAFIMALKSSPTLLRWLMEQIRAEAMSAAQANACNLLHDARQRLCNHLLRMQERLGGDTVPLTQQDLGLTLGVQRTTVTALAQELMTRGAISYSRGKIRIVNREILTHQACRCYGVAALPGEAPGPQMDRRWVAVAT